MATPGNGKETGPGAQHATRDLADRIAKAQRARETGHTPAASGGAKDMSALGRGLRLGTEFIAAILVGAGIGYVLDSWLGTGPWLLLAMLLVGFAAGVLNVTRAVAAMNRAAPPPDGPEDGPG